MKLIEVEDGIAFVFRWEFRQELQNALRILEKYEVTLKDNPDKLAIIQRAKDVILLHVCTIH